MKIVERKAHARSSEQIKLLILGLWVVSPRLFHPVLGNAHWPITLPGLCPSDISLSECGSHYGPGRERSLHMELCPQKGSLRKASLDQPIHLTDK